MEMEMGDLIALAQYYLLISGKAKQIHRNILPRNLF